MDPTAPRPAPALDVLIVPTDVRTTVATAVAVEDVGYRRLWVAESPPLGRPDCYLTLNECARATRTLVVCPGVTNPVTRHVSVTAGAAATLHELAGGRVVLGMGAGGSAVLGAGLRPATPSNVPEIGRTRYRNLYLNTGHGTLGWTLAAGSGAALADLISGRQPEVDFPFR